MDNKPAQRLEPVTRKPIRRLSTPVRRDVTPLSRRGREAAKPLLKHASPIIPSARPLHEPHSDLAPPPRPAIDAVHHNPSPEDLGIRTDVEPDTTYSVDKPKSPVHFELPVGVDLEAEFEQLRPSTIIKPGSKERLSSGFAFKLHKFMKGLGLVSIVLVLLAGLALALEFRGVKSWLRGVTGQASKTAAVTVASTLDQPLYSLGLPKELSLKPADETIDDDSVTSLNQISSTEKEGKVSAFIFVDGASKAVPGDVLSDATNKVANLVFKKYFPGQGEGKLSTDSDADLKIVEQKAGKVKGSEQTQLSIVTFKIPATSEAQTLYIAAIYLKDSKVLVYYGNFNAGIWDQYWHAQMVALPDHTVVKP